MNIARAATFLAAAAAAACLANAANAEVRSDNFDGPDLSGFWNIMNEDKADISFENGQIKLEAKHDANVWVNLDATFLYQETSGDFDVETNAIFDYMPASVVAGLIAYSPATPDHAGRDGQWVTLKHWGRDADAIIQYQRRENHDGGLGYVGQVPNYLKPAGEMPIALRLARAENEYTAWYKDNGEGDWIQVGTVVNELQNPVQIGIYAGIADAAGGALTVWFDDFTEADTPFNVNPKGKAAAAWARLKNN